MPNDFVSIANASKLGLPSAGPEPLQWVQLFPAGPHINTQTGQRYRLGDPEGLIASSRPGLHRMVVDYDHQSEFAKGSQAPAAGWIKDLEVRQSSIWAQIEWTPSGLNRLKDRQYRYISPVFQVTASGQIKRLLRAGLTNNPNLDMKALASAVTTEETALADPNDKQPEDSSDEEKAKDAGNKSPEAGGTVPATATPADTKPGKPKPVDPKPADLIPDTTQAASAGQPNLASLQDQVRALSAQVEALTSNDQHRAGAALVETATAAGKITPAMKGWAEAYAAKDPEGFKAYCTAASPLIGEATAAAVQRKPDENGLTAEELAVCSVLGQDPKAFATAKAAIKAEEVNHDSTH